MRRSLSVALALSFLVSCGGEKIAVTQPPRTPLPAPPSTSQAEASPPRTPQRPAPAAEDASPEELAELADREQEAALEIEAALRAPEDGTPVAFDSQLDPAFSQLAEPAAPTDPSLADDPEQPALEAEQAALIDELVEVEESLPPDATLSERRQFALENTKSDMPLTLNSQVIGMIKYFTEGRGRATIRATLGRSGAYREMIERVLEEEDVPLELFYLAQAESGFRPKARSYARATGMWQFMAFRGKQYGLRQDRYLEERHDAEKATRAAARHLKDLHIEFGDWYLAMAAYNSGPGRVRRAIERGNTTDYWEMCQRRLLPRQTRNYVPIILAMAYVDKNLKMYDVGTIDYAPSRKYDTVEISEEVSLELLADIAGTRVSELEDLNPALTRSATPPQSYALRVPEGEGETLLAELATIPADKRMEWRRHDVNEGETLEEVAARWKVAADEIARVNGLQPGAQLSAGLSLNVPTRTQMRMFSRWGGAGGLVDDGSGRYRIANGDTLGSIARRFGVSVAQLRAWNGLPNSFIRAGRYLVVRPNGGGSGGSQSASSNPGPAPDGSYRVRPGDTLGKIAQRNGTTVSQLMAWNGLRSTRIQVGQTLKVPGSAPSQAAASSAGPSGPGQYRIRRGDNLAAIGQRFGVSVRDLQSWNGLRSTRITAGEYLRVRPPSANEPTTTTTAAAVDSPAGGGAKYRVRSGDTLAVIARRNGASVADIQRWNGLRSTRIQIGQTLIVGSGGGSAAPAVETAKLDGPVPQAPPARSSETKYKIRSGDTLGGIAERFGVTASDLRSWNQMRGSRITAGEYLVVRPPNASAPASSASSSPAPAPQRASSASSTETTYKIRSGDTLGAIAERFGVTASDLRRWNGIRGSRITAGDTLTVRAPQTARASQDEGGRYRIQPGDTLAVIARRFGVSVDDLKAWNGLRSTRITAGRYLTVSAGGAGGG